MTTRVLCRSCDSLLTAPLCRWRQGPSRGPPRARAPALTGDDADSLVAMTSAIDQHPVDLDDPATDPFTVARLAAEHLARVTGIERHDLALVLGSGWGGAADLLGETV